MEMLMSSIVVLLLMCLALGSEVRIDMESEAWTKLDYVAPRMTREAETLSTNPCISQKTCRDCIRAHPKCAWCAKKDMNYTDSGKSRCNYANIIKDECGEHDMVNITYYKGEKISERELMFWVRPKHPFRISLTFYTGSRDFPLVGFTDDAPDNIRLTYSSNCSRLYHTMLSSKQSTCRDEPRRRTQICRDVKAGTTNVEFEVNITIISCPENRDEWNQTIVFSPVHEGDKPKFVHLHLLCECDCEKPGNEEKNSLMCSGRGTYHCGVCSCHEHWYGKQCECNDKDCVAPGDTKICSGRGRCNCGVCECFDKTNVTGRFCECDACPKSKDGQICGGEDHGRCACGKCECTDEWTGAACDCMKDTKPCRSPYNHRICHGSGECRCGQCHCLDQNGILPSGPYCEVCNMCPLKCAKYRRCMRCHKYQ